MILRFKESDLPLEVWLMIKEPIPTDAAPRHALQLCFLDHGFLSRRLAVMTDEVMLGRKVKVQNLHAPA
jgi:hypothetical protein